MACVLLVVLLAAVLRFAHLTQRPMHADEAVNADKFGTLLEQGRYEYDPTHFHGPSLSYLTLLPARIQGIARYVDLDEATLRSGPAALGVLLVAASILLIPIFGEGAALAAALLAAVSPAMVFYSRDFIHETLLVCFAGGALISLFRYLWKPGAGWAVAAGVFAGLMYATKETAVIAFVALALGGALNVAFETWRDEGGPLPRTQPRWAHVLMGSLAASLVAVIFFSSWFSHPRGIIDSFQAYRTYFGMAGGGSLHRHPWHYYLDLLLFSNSPGSPVWTEGLIVVLAIVGFVAGLGRKGIPGVDKGLLRVLGFYTVIMVVVYSLIPYKTPWCLLGFLHGMTLLAGVGLMRLLQVCTTRGARGVAVVLFVAAAAHLGWQAWAGSSRFDADPRNPWVYAHTSRDVYTIVRQVEDMARAHPDGRAMPVQVITRENMWPLPWYLRRFTGVRWSTAVLDGVPNAPVILVTPDMEPALARKLYDVAPPGERELYVNVFSRRVELRPQVEVRAYAAKTFWDEYRQRDANVPAPAPGRARR